MACAERQHHNTDAFSARTSGFRTFESAPHVKGHPTRRPTLPRLPVQTFAPAPPLCPCVPADVAANLTCLATTVRAPWRECWGEPISLWRWPLSKCAERQEPASPETSTSVTWIWPSSTFLDGDVWRSSQMVSLCGRARSSPSVQPWSHPSAVTGLPGQGRSTMMRPRWRRLVVGRSAPDCPGTGVGDGRDPLWPVATVPALSCPGSTLARSEKVRRRWERSRWEGCAQT